MRPQPLISVRDVTESSRFYRQLLGAGLGGDGDGHGDGGGHGRKESVSYERLYDPARHQTVWGTDGLILQLHAWDVDEHQGDLGDPDRPVGNGVLLWFEVDDFDDAVERARELDAPVVQDVYDNPNAGHREFWLRDPDGYTVVLASADGFTGSDG